MSEISDKELRLKLKEYGKNVGPINSDTVRKVLYKKLLEFQNGGSKQSIKAVKKSKNDTKPLKSTKTSKDLSKSKKSTKSVQKLPELNFDDLSDKDFRKKCIEHGLKPGPISSTTRKTWENKLRKKLDELDSKLVVSDQEAKQEASEDTEEEQFEAKEISIQTSFRGNESNWVTFDDLEEMDCSEDVFYLSTQDIIDETENYDSSSSLRPIVIDGSNIACAHGKQKVFSFKGIELVFDFFANRGHQEIYVVLPHARTSKNFRGSGNLKSTDFDILGKLNELNVLCISPARQIGSHGRYVASYDDKQVIELASRIDGVVVSNDFYRDIYDEAKERRRSDWIDVIEKNILNFSFVKDLFMPVDDPMGKGSDVRLDDFLKN